MKNECKSPTESRYSSTPFFLIGCPRSGTTLLQVLMDSHPNLSIPPESHIFEHFIPILDNYNNLNEKENFLRLSSDILSDFPIKQWDLKITPSDLWQKCESKSFSGIVSVIFETYTKKFQKKRWGDKTPQHIFYLAEIKQIFPRSRFIFLM